ncbi:MAG: amidohydrolase family protein [Colwellia sp.]|nr:amidohydrolase family protein [Colwellia sp.]
MNVLIDNGRIVNITRNKVTSYGLKINGSGKFLTPGIMDSHAHVSSIPGMGFGVDPMSVKHPKLTKSYFKQQPRSFLYYGVTQVLDPNPGLNWHHFTSAENHPDYFRCEVITSTHTFPYVEKQDDKSRSMFTYLIDEKAPRNGANSAEDIVQKIANSGASCIKIYFEDGYGNASQWPTFSPKTLDRIKVSAKKVKLPILAHANALDMQQLALSARVDVIVHGMWNWGEHSHAKDIPAQISNVLENIIVNKIGYMPTQRVIAGLGEVMLPNIGDSPEFSLITPKPLLNWYKTPEAQWFKEELRIGFDGMPDKSIAGVFLYGRIGKGNKVINYLNKSKHPILLASDFPGSPSFANQPGLTTYQEMKAMVDAGLTLNEVLAAATINNAKQFKIQDDYGTVEVGKIANLLLLKKNPLSSIEAWDSIDTIILNGQPIARHTLSVKQ